MNVKIKDELGKYRHAYTHFRVTLHAFTTALVSDGAKAIMASEIHWVMISDLSEFPMEKLDRMISNDLERKSGSNG
jgi:A/G-specific adenine glycosylase